MTRETYLAELAAYLKRLPKTDFEDSMAYFTELFDDAGPEGEADLIASLGTPREASADIMGVLLGKKWDDAETNRDKINVVHFALISILAAPIAFPLMLILLCVIVTGVIMVLSILIALYVIAFSLMLTCAAFLWENLVHFQTLGLLFFNFGGMLISLGLGLLLFIGTFIVTKYLGKGIVVLAKTLYGKVKKNG